MAFCFVSVYGIPTPVSEHTSSFTVFASRQMSLEAIVPIAKKQPCNQSGLSIFRLLVTIGMGWQRGSKCRGVWQRENKDIMKPEKDATCGKSIITFTILASSNNLKTYPSLCTAGYECPRGGLLLLVRSLCRASSVDPTSKFSLRG